MRKEKCYRVFNYRSLLWLGEHTAKLVCQSYLLSVNVLFSGLSSGPTSCLQILYLLAYLKKCLGSTLILETATCSSWIFSFKWLLLICSSIESSCEIIWGVRKMILQSLVLLRIKTLRSFWNLDFLASLERFNGTWIEHLEITRWNLVKLMDPVCTHIACIINAWIWDTSLTYCIHTCYPLPLFYVVYVYNTRILFDDYF